MLEYVWLQDLIGREYNTSDRQKHFTTEQTNENWYIGSVSRRSHDLGRAIEWIHVEWKEQVDIGITLRYASLLPCSFCLYDGIIVLFCVLPNAMFRTHKTLFSFFWLFIHKHKKMIDPPPPPYPPISARALCTLCCCLGRRRGQGQILKSGNI